MTQIQYDEYHGTGFTQEMHAGGISSTQISQDRLQELQVRG